MRSVTPKARTSTAAMDTGAAQRREADGFASAWRDAARIAASMATRGSSRGSARYTAFSLSPFSFIADRFLAVAGSRLDRAHPDLLEELLRLRVRLHRAQHEAEERSLVAGVEGLERRRVAAGIGEHQLFVGGRHTPYITGPA